MPDTSICILIPAYKPDERLIALCGKLREAGLSILVVDDGSGEPYLPVFKQARMLGCHVERHAVNLGKGRALKTGMNAALCANPALEGIITADADGQHTCEDILRVLEAMRAHPGALVTGARTLREGTPRKSRAGNSVTRLLYRFVTGIRCQDTQTGLRGVPAKVIGQMLSLPGERYEYEMTMLLRLRELDLPLFEVPIETIYIDDNKGSHFHPFRDAMRVFAVILRFAFASFLSFCIDYGLYLYLLRGLSLAPWLCYALAKGISSLFNYGFNRFAVFGGRGNKLSLLRYYLLVALNLAIGSALVEALHQMTGFSAGWIKIPVDLLLFFVNYLMQRDFVFGDRR